MNATPHNILFYITILDSYLVILFIPLSYISSERPAKVKKGGWEAVEGEAMEIPRYNIYLCPL